MRISVSIRLTIILTCIFVCLDANSKSCESSSRITARVSGVNTLDLGLANLNLSLEAGNSNGDGFIGAPFSLYARSTSINGFYVQVFAAARFVDSEYWKLVYSENEDYYLRFSLICDHDSSGALTPLASEGYVIQPVGGTNLFNNSKIIDMQSMSTQAFDYYLYPFILPFQINSLPAGLYQGTLRLILEDY